MVIFLGRRSGGLGWGDILEDILNLDYYQPCMLTCDLA